MTYLVIAKQYIDNDDNLFSLNDLHKAAGGLDRHKPANWLRNQQTIDLIAELKYQETTSQIRAVEQNQLVTSKPEDPIIKVINGGNSKGTYVCKELVIHYAMWVSPVFSLQVIRSFLWDEAYRRREHKYFRKMHEEKIDADQEAMVHFLVRRYCEQANIGYQYAYNNFFAYAKVSRADEISRADFAKAMQWLHLHSGKIFTPKMLALGKHAQTVAKKQQPIATLPTATQTTPKSAVAREYDSPIADSFVCAGSGNHDDLPSILEAAHQDMATLINAYNQLAVVAKPEDCPEAMALGGYLILSNLSSALHQLAFNQPS